MQERHRDRKQYFDEQITTTEKYVVPYVQDVISLGKGDRVLEIGCGEGGNMVPFLKMGCEVVGVDLSEKQIENARVYIEDLLPGAPVELYYKNIYDTNPEKLGKFDLIMMRDVIEHIHDQEKFMKFLKAFLKPEGRVFFGFPPWRMPFGGHQQVCKSKILSKTPYFHLLNKNIYSFVLKSFGESESTVSSLLETKETGISIGRFEKIVNNQGYRFDKKTLYLINPNYEVKFGLTPREQNGIVKSIPWFKDFFTTCCYCIIKLNPAKAN